MFWLFWVMGLTVVGLAGAAAWLWWQVWRQADVRVQKALQQQEQQARSEIARLDYIYESLNVIARAVLDGQCPITEGCIRMAVLMDNLSLDCNSKHRFSVLFDVYNATRHIPTHSRWQALGRKEKRQYQQQMLTLEKQHQSTVMDIMTFIRDNPFGTVQKVTLN